MITNTFRIAGLVAAGVFAASAPASAGECSPEHVLTEARAIDNAPDIGVQRPVLASVDLTGWRNMGNFMLRLRRLTIAADGVVPTHRHDDRPSIVYILKGELIEHSDRCAVPVLHSEGEWAAESGAHGHWWENKTGEEVVVLSTDVIPFLPAKPAEMQQMGDM